jgi:hypothetical protein
MTKIFTGMSKEESEAQAKAQRWVDSQRDLIKNARLRTAMRRATMPSAQDDSFGWTTTVDYEQGRSVGR